MFVDERQVALFAAGASREGEGAGSEERVRLYHGYEKPVTLDRVHVREIAPDQDRDGPERDPGREYAARSLLGVDSVVPGKATSTLDLSALRPSRAGSVRELEIVGRAGDYEARGIIVLTSTVAPAEAESTALSSASIEDLEKSIRDAEER